ncbi:MAG: response regulator [bacterium]|nr:MAG: response regulator [bacterium]
MGKKILVVDDENLVRWSVKRYLEAEGYQTLEASSGQEALRILDMENVGVMITDLMMPGMDGVELIRRARARQPHLSVLVITASHSSGMLRSARDAGAIRTFEKPIPFRDLLGTLQGLEH